MHERFWGWVTSWWWSDARIHQRTATCLAGDTVCGENQIYPGLFPTIFKIFPASSCFLLFFHWTVVLLTSTDSCLALAVILSASKVWDMDPLFHRDSSDSITQGWPVEGWVSTINLERAHLPSIRWGSRLFGGVAESLHEAHPNLKAELSCPKKCCTSIVLYNITHARIAHMYRNMYKSRRDSSTISCR